MAAPRIGPYEILRTLGQGATGIVYEVRRPPQDERFALKLLADTSPELVARFMAEARVLRALKHPRIVALRDVGEERGRPFIVMDLLEGGTFEHLLKSGHPRESLVSKLIVVARALHHAHEAGVVHRDVKPANILIDASGQPVVTDFGLAKNLQGDALTRSGTVLGTAGYMAPEQVERGSAVDRRADIYSLGAILYRVLTGRRPHEGDDVAIWKKLLLEEPPAPRAVVPELTAEIEAVTLKALAKRPDARYETAEKFARDLELAASGAAPVAAAKTGSSRPLAIAGLSVALLVTTGLLVRERVTGGAETERLRGEAVKAAAEAEKARAEAEKVRAELDTRRGDNDLGRLLLGAGDLTPAARERLLDDADAVARKGDVEGACLRCLAVANVSERSGRPGAAAVALARAAKHVRATPERAAPLLARACLLDIDATATTLGQDRSLALVLRDRAIAQLSLDELEKVDRPEDTIRAARRSLLHARLLEPRGVWRQAGEALRRLRTSSREAIRTTARVWTVGWNVEVLFDPVLEAPFDKGALGRACADDGSLYPKPFDGFYTGHAVDTRSAGLVIDATSDFLLWKPEASFLWHQLGYYLLASGRDLESVRAFSVCAVLEGEGLSPRSYGPGLYGGLAELRLGRPDRAIALLRRSTENAPPAAAFWPYYHLAEALIRSDAPGVDQRLAEALAILDNFPDRGGIFGDHLRLLIAEKRGQKDEAARLHREWLVKAGWR